MFSGLTVVPGSMTEGFLGQRVNESMGLVTRFSILRTAQGALGAGFFFGRP